MFILLFVTFAGFSASLVAWQLMRLFTRARSAHEQPTLPRAWRWIWPMVTVLAPWCESRLSWGQRDRLVRFALQADLPAGVGPAQMMAGLMFVVIFGFLSGAAFMLAVGLPDSTLLVAMLSGLLSGACLISHFVSKVKKRRRKIERELPFVLDIMTLCVESGLSLHAALQQAEQHGPCGPLREALARTLSDMRSGMPRLKALQALASRCECAAVTAWVATLIQGDRIGMNVAVLLREHAAQCRVERIQRAEKLAMEAPVKMLFPLIGCIFPCTFIVLAFPIVLQIQQAFP